MKKPPAVTQPKATKKEADKPLPLERRLISYHELPAMGISFSITHLRRMWRDGRFPEPVYTSTRRFAWPIEVLDQWINDRNTTPNRGRTKAEA